MKVSPGFIERVKQEEGFSATSYWDNKQWTRGFGTKAPGPNALVTMEYAEKELRVEIEEAERDFRAAFPVDPPGLSQARYDSLVDMLFNLGLTAFSGFHNTVAAIRVGDWILAAAHAEQSLWYRQVGSRAKRICNEFRYAVEAAPVILPVGQAPEKATPPTPTGAWWMQLIEMIGKLLKGGKA